MTENEILHAARYLRDHRYSFKRPRFERHNGTLYLIAQDEDTWKFKVPAPAAMWSRPYDSFEDAVAAAQARIDS